MSRAGRARGYAGALLISLAAVAVATWAGGLDADRRKLALEARRLSVETDALYRRAGEVEAAAAQARRQRALYESLMDRGFTRPLIPSDLAAALAEGARGGDIGRLIYDIGTEPGPSSRWQGVRSVPVTLDLWTATDGAVVDFFTDLSIRVEGALRVGVLTVERTGDVDAAVLTAVREGEHPPLVRAQAVLEWSTMAPAEVETRR